MPNLSPDEIVLRLEAWAARGIKFKLEYMRSLEGNAGERIHLWTIGQIRELKQGAIIFRLENGLMRFCTDAANFEAFPFPSPDSSSCEIRIRTLAGDYLQLTDII